MSIKHALELADQQLHKQKQRLGKFKNIPIQQNLQAAPVTIPEDVCPECKNVQALCACVEGELVKEGLAFNVETFAEVFKENEEKYMPYDPEKDGPMHVDVCERTFRVDIWKPGDAVIVAESIAVDTETEELVKGEPIKEVLIQATSLSSKRVQIAMYPNVIPYWEELIKQNARTEFIFHNAAFDLKVLGMHHTPWLIEAVNGRAVNGAPRIVDTQLRFILKQLSKGIYFGASSLAHASKLILGESIDKDAQIRLTFFQGMPMNKDHLLYAAKDPVATLLLREALDEEQHTESTQVKGSIALYDIGNRGFLIDREYQETLRKKFSEKIAINKGVLGQYGWYAGKGSDKKLQILLSRMERQANKDLAPRSIDLIKAQFQPEGEDALKLNEVISKPIFPRTAKTKDIQCGKKLSEVYKAIKIEPPAFLMQYNDYQHNDKIAKTYLDAKIISGDSRVHSHFKPIMVTGRTSSSDPNLQNTPREEDIRGCYLAPEGSVLYACDYSQLELCALAQTCYTKFGYSTMREVINSGVDVHMFFGMKIKTAYVNAELLRKVAEYQAVHRAAPSDEMIQGMRLDVEATCMEDKAYRQQAKACNFGYPGGLGASTFVDFAKIQYGQTFTVEQAKELKNIFLQSFPEMKDHLSPDVDVATMDAEAYKGNSDTWYLGKTISGRIRRRCSYNEACNYPFQGLAADGAKNALWYMYCERFNSVNFVHDETITELKNDDSLQEQCKRVDYLMIEAMKVFIPDVNIAVEGALMHRWHKKAEPLYDKGKLLIWTPELQEAFNKKEKEKEHNG